MGKASICEKTGLKRGTWTAEEDKLLSDYIKRYGIWNWRELPKYAGLSRCGKSCRLRWMNYLQPDVKRGNYTKEEDELIIEMHEKLGNRWAKIAASLPGRTDNELKNRWHTHLKNGLNSKVLSKRGRRKKEGIPAWRDKKWKICSDESKAVAPIILESSGIFPELTEKSNENSSTDSEISKVSEKGNEISSSSSEDGSEISEVAEKGNDISSPSSLTVDSENSKVSEEESVDSIFDEILQFSCNASDWEWVENSLDCYDPMPEVPIFPQVEVGYYSDFYHCEDGMDFSFNNFSHLLGATWLCP